MTRKELENYFKNPMYDSIRYAVDAVMSSNPEITDRFTIEAAADKIDECREAGVELSVENALRLVNGLRQPDVKEIVKFLTDNGVTNANIGTVVDRILNEVAPNPTGEKPKASAQHKARILNSYAKVLTDQNSDIVLLGVPDIDPGWTFAQLKLAFFSENLTDGQKTMLGNMKAFSDDVKFTEKNGYAEVIFYINDLK